MSIPACLSAYLPPSQIPICPFDLPCRAHPLTPGLGEWVSKPCTYAGGARDISDLELVDKLSSGKVDLTFGSSLDIFGGTGVKFDELVKVDAKAKAASAGAA